MNKCSLYDILLCGRIQFIMRGCVLLYIAYYICNRWCNSSMACATLNVWYFYPFHPELMKVATAATTVEGSSHTEYARDCLIGQSARARSTPSLYPFSRSFPPSFALYVRACVCLCVRLVRAFCSSAQRPRIHSALPTNTCTARVQQRCDWSISVLLLMDVTLITRMHVYGCIIIAYIVVAERELSSFPTI